MLKAGSINIEPEFDCYLIWVESGKVRDLIMYEISDQIHWIHKPISHP